MDCSPLSGRESAPRFQGFGGEIRPNLPAPFGPHSQHSVQLPVSGEGGAPGSRRRVRSQQIMITRFLKESNHVRREATVAAEVRIFISKILELIGKQNVSDYYPFLASGLESAWNKLEREEVLTKENIVKLMKDIRRALLEVDVSLPVVRRFVQAVSDQAVGTGLIRGVKHDQQLVKIVSDELVKLIGGEVSELEFSKTKPTVILLAGLQRVGKTTVSAKLALYLKKLGKSCMLIVGDVYRPAAIDQLVILGDQV